MSTTKQRLIALSITEAIDWTQDRLGSTRPIAESVLFSMLADRKVEETDDGYVLHEGETDEDDDRDMLKRKAHRMSRTNAHRVRFKFGGRRKALTERREILRQRLQAMGYSDEAEDMNDEEAHQKRIKKMMDFNMHLPPGWRDRG